MVHKRNYKRNSFARGTKRPPPRSLKSKAVAAQVPSSEEIDPYSLCPPPAPGWNSADWYKNCVAELRIR